MKINNEEVTLEELVKEISPRTHMFKNCGNGIYLSNDQIEVLKQHGFSYQSYSNIKSLIFDIEEYINENPEQELEDLEMVANTLAEFNYYYHVNK